MSLSLRACATYRKTRYLVQALFVFREVGGTAGFDYSSSNGRWQRLRMQALRRDKFRCREALRYGRVEEATHVHHIWPAEDYPEYAYCLWNLVSLTKANHDAMHDRKTRKLTALGFRWKNRTPPPSGPEK